MWVDEKLVVRGAEGAQEIILLEDCKKSKSKSDTAGSAKWCTNDVRVGSSVDRVDYI